MGAVLIFLLVILALTFIGALVLIGFGLVFGPGINAARAERKRQRDFEAKYGVSMSEWNDARGWRAGMSAREWSELSIIDSNAIILSWDLNGKRGGPFVPWPPDPNEDRSKPCPRVNA